MSSTSCSGLPLTDVVSRLDSMAPPSLAESWDNVGLLVSPSLPKTVRRMLLTNDLTDPVLLEAVRTKTDLILSYHPPIFKALKRVTLATWKERLVATCLENRMAVYAPHTAYDVMAGGVADWLLSAFDGSVSVLKPHMAHPSNLGYQVRVRGVGPTTSGDPKMTSLLQLAATRSDVRLHMDDACGGMVEAMCSKEKVAEVVQAATALAAGGGEEQVQVTKLEGRVAEGMGVGRKVVLQEEISLRQAVDKVKTLCKLDKIRVAVAVGKDLDSVIGSVCCCPGSGASVLSGTSSCDLWLTGEMSHHELLEATHSGVSVILAEHSNSERGFLADKLKDRLDTLLQHQVEIVVSGEDCDPVKIV